jgi:type IV pilus assembly protein PilC
MLYRYRAIDTQTNQEREGSIEATNVDIAIAALQRRKLIIVEIHGVDELKIWQKYISTEKSIKYREVVILSRQIATLFKAQISALRVFQLLTTQVENPSLQKRLNEITEDIQGGMSMSSAMAKHPDVFSDFYINMVKAGEESGNLSSTFLYLADYLDRSYELQAKIRNALLYPGVVITVFISVMVLMLVLVIPKLSVIILESGGEIPMYTKFVIALSNFFVNYGLLLLLVIILAASALWGYMRSAEGKRVISAFILSLPYFGDLYRKFFLARIADNMNTMLTSGIAVVHAVEVTADVVGNQIYKDALMNVAQNVRTGSTLSAAMSVHPEIPPIMVQMIKVGEETGEVGSILDTLAKFYKREVDNAVDTLIGLIEPAMIVLLGIGVGGLLVSVLMPIYNLTSSY